MCVFVHVFMCVLCVVFFFFFLQMCICTFLYMWMCVCLCLFLCVYINIYIMCVCEFVVFKYQLMNCVKFLMISLTQFDLPTFVWEVWVLMRLNGKGRCHLVRRAETISYEVICVCLLCFIYLFFSELLTLP